MNLQCSLIQEHMLYEFKLGHKVMEITKNICYTKGEGIVNPSTINRWFQKFRLHCKNLDNQARSCNLVSSTQRVSGKLSISQSSVLCHLYIFNKSIWSSLTVPHISKILQNFWFSIVSKKFNKSDRVVLYIYIYIYIYQQLKDNKINN